MTLNYGNPNQPQGTQPTVTLTAGRNAVNVYNGTVTINESVGGDSNTNSRHEVTIGGVGVSKEQFDAVLEKFSNARWEVMQKASAGEVNRDDADKVIKQLEVIKEEVTNHSGRANGKRMADAGRLILRLSPILAGTLVSIFADPIIGEITTQAGGAAVEFFQHIQRIGGAATA